MSNGRFGNVGTKISGVGGKVSGAGGVFKDTSDRTNSFGGIPPDVYLAYIAISPSEAIAREEAIYASQRVAEFRAKGLLK